MTPNCLILLSTCKLLKIYKVGPLIEYTLWFGTALGLDNMVGIFLSTKAIDLM